MATPQPSLRPALRYYGGKWRIAKWIIGHFPDHTCYVEPFGGAMSVLLSKPPSEIQVYNDIDRDLVTFFKVLREHPNDLVRAIQLTPFSRAELKISNQPCEDELERARRVYVWSMQGISGTRSSWTTGWRFQRNPRNGRQNIEVWRDVGHLEKIAERLLSVNIECDDAMKVIRRYDTPDTLFYCDPPYPSQTRSKWSDNGYLHEMMDEQHTQLAELLSQIKGMAAVSTYPNEMYDRLYSNWQCVRTRARVNLVNRGGKSVVECLYLSPSLSARHAQKRML
jgi:DNA adenine methylase